MFEGEFHKNKDSKLKSRKKYHVSNLRGQVPQKQGLKLQSVRSDHDFARFEGKFHKNKD